MKMVIACALALGMAATTASARAGSPDCCKGNAGCAASCSANEMVCLDADGITVAELAHQLSEKMGVEIRVQGPGFEKLKLKVCAATPEEALTQVATALHARWNLAYIFGSRPHVARRNTPERAVTVTFCGAPAASAAFVTAAQGGGVLIADRPLTGKVTFQGKNVPVSMALDAVAVSAGLKWMPAYVLQTGPSALVTRRTDRPKSDLPARLQLRPGAPGAHHHPSASASTPIAPAPGMIVISPEEEMSRLERESMRRQQLGEWATIFTQETPRETRRAIRDLRIRVETTIQKLESYPPQDRTLAAGLWHARYERMVADYANLTPEQQKQVQPVMEVMKYFAAAPGK